eukprot:1153076-Pelagomonas_calceolata.AAC.2
MWVWRFVSHPPRCAPGSPARSPFHNPLPRSPIAGVTEMDGMFEVMSFGWWVESLPSRGRSIMPSGRLSCVFGGRPDGKTQYGMFLWTSSGFPYPGSAAFLYCMHP